MALFSAEHLSLHLGAQTILADVSLTLAPGEIVALAGESGAGKTSLALAALSLLAQQDALEGAIRFDGRFLNDLSEKEKNTLRGGGIGLVFQEPAAALDPVQRAGTQIAETLRLHKPMSASARRTAVDGLLNRVGLSPAYAARFPHELSGGQRQRVAIAMAIAAAPRLLIADEPTAALDAVGRAQILELLQMLVREDNLALLLITHDLAVARLASRLAVMVEGRIVEEGHTQTVLAAPVHPFTRKFANSLHPPAMVWDAPVTGAPLLSMTNVCRSYGTDTNRVTALADVSLQLAQGACLGVVGASGSGKSTLMRLALGLETPDRGTVHLAGQSWCEARADARKAMRRMVQAVFQDPLTSFNPRHRVGRIVAEPLHLWDGPLSRGARQEKVTEALAQVGLSPDAARRYPHEFSGGQRQRIAIARALILNPALIVLDEALSALDAAARGEILDLLSALRRSRGVSFLFITHDLAQLRAFADQVVVMDRGRVVEEGPVRAVLAAPAHPATQALVAAANPMLTI